MVLWWALFLLLQVLVNDATCLAVNNAPITRVVSTKKDGGLSKTFTFDGTSTPQLGSPLSGKHGIQQIQAALRSTFLPSGYPSKTPPGYLSYSMWSWIQDVSTQLRSVLATQRVLEGVGVGREGATALSALMNFLVRDGCGMASTLMFTSVASSRFKTDVKRWRLFADIMVDIGITLEVAATLVPKQFFLSMISLGNMCKAMCGVAAGACGGAIHLHWAKGSDISDINAKFGAQHTVTGSLGLVFAAAFARSVATIQPTKLWTLYSILTILHIYANMKCMKLIAFDSLNNARMNLVLAEFFQWWDNNTEEESLVAKPIQQSSPKHIAQVEPLFFIGPWPAKICPLPIHFGVSFDEFYSRTERTPLEMESILYQLNDDRYMLATGSSHGHLSVVVSFLLHATPEDQAKAYFHAILLSRQLHKNGPNLGYDGGDIIAAELSAREELEKSWGVFRSACQNLGWDLSKTELRSHGYELEIS